MTVNVNINQEVITYGDIKICDVFKYNGYLWLKIDDTVAFKFYNLMEKCEEYDTDDFYIDTEIIPVKAELKIEV